MITLISIFTILYVYSISDIRKESGSWYDFDPSMSSKYFWAMFFKIGSILDFVFIAYLIIKYLP